MRLMTDIATIKREVTICMFDLTHGWSHASRPPQAAAPISSQGLDGRSSRLVTWWRPRALEN